jgi:hypothetical protein
VAGERARRGVAHHRRRELRAGSAGEGVRDAQGERHPAPDHEPARRPRGPAPPAQGGPAAARQHDARRASADRRARARAPRRRAHGRRPPRPRDRARREVSIAWRAWRRSRPRCCSSSSARSATRPTSTSRRA